MASEMAILRGRRGNGYGSEAECKHHGMALQHVRHKCCDLQRKANAPLVSRLGHWNIIGFIQGLFIRVNCHQLHYPQSTKQCLSRSLPCYELLVLQARPP